MDLDRRGDLHSKGFIVLPNPEQNHECDAWKAHRENFKRESQGGWYEVDPIRGTVWQCPECGRYWVVRTHDIHPAWVRMRWYHEEARIIRRLGKGR